MFDELRQLLAIMSQYEHLSLPIVLFTMGLAIGCGFVLYLTYRFFYRGLAYSNNFGILIVMISVITAFIIITIGANLVLSLGMVGALSIVRFRAAIKEPLDVGFIYASVAIGLTAGARLYTVTLLGTAAVCATYIVMTFLKKEKRNFLLVLQYESEHDAAVQQLLAGTKHRLKNKTVSGAGVELTVEVNLKGNDTAFLQPFTTSGKVESAVLVEYNGDYA